MFGKNKEPAEKIDYIPYAVLPKEEELKHFEHQKERMLKVELAREAFKAQDKRRSIGKKFLDFITGHNFRTREFEYIDQEVYSKEIDGLLE